MRCGQNGMAVRSGARPISRILASDGTTQTPVLAATRRDGTIWAHFVVASPCNIRDIAADSAPRTASHIDPPHVDIIETGSSSAAPARWKIRAWPDRQRVGGGALRPATVPGLTSRSFAAVDVSDAQSAPGGWPQQTGPTSGGDHAFGDGDGRQDLAAGDLQLASLPW